MNIVSTFHAAVRIVLVACPIAFGQEFEVATIKLAPERPLQSIASGILPPCSSGPGTSSPSRLSCQGFTLQRLIEYAYSLRPAQIEGPGWIEERRFDVAAGVPEGTTILQTRVMMQNLLAERFHLVVQRERRTRPIYRLTVAKGGFKRKPIAELSDDKRRMMDAESRAVFMKHSQERIAQGDTRPWFRLVAIGTIEDFIEIISRYVCCTSGATGIQVREDSRTSRFLSRQECRESAG